MSLPDGVIKLPEGKLVHQDSILGKAFRQATDELAKEAHQDCVLDMKKRILARRARPWWKRVLPFYITFHWSE